MRCQLPMCLVTLITALTIPVACQGLEQNASFRNSATDEITSVFNEVTFFDFRLNFNNPTFVAGQAYANPPLDSVTYQVNGVLPQPTPSGFPQFFLEREIDGEEFYDQGSSMEFEIREDAFIDDGIQISELVNGLVLNAREVDTGRYHPPLLELFPDGTGRLQNSNNTGGVNPASMMKIDVDFGEEYIVDLTFDPEHTTLINGFPLGDLNRSCNVSLEDIAPFVDALIDPAYDYLADINQDGSDDLLDISALITFLGG